MPQEPSEFRIVTNLQAALQAITVAGGYHYTVMATAVKLDPDVKVEDLLLPNGPRPFVLIEVMPDVWRYHPASQIDLVMPVTIHWVSEKTPTADISRLETYYRGCADVEMAITKDIGRGGLATDTRIVRRGFDTAAEGSQVWAVIETEIRPSRTYGQPNW